MITFSAALFFGPGFLSSMYPMGAFTRCGRAETDLHAWLVELRQDGEQEHLVACPMRVGEFGHRLSDTELVDEAIIFLRVRPRDH